MNDALVLTSRKPFYTHTAKATNAGARMYKVAGQECPCLFDGYLVNVAYVLIRARRCRRVNVTLTYIYLSGQLYPVTE